MDSSKQIPVENIPSKVKDGVITSHSIDSNIEHLRNKRSGKKENLRDLSTRIQNV